MHRWLGLIIVVLLFGCDGQSLRSSHSPQFTDGPTSLTSPSASCTPSMVSTQQGNSGPVEPNETGSFPIHTPTPAFCKTPATAITISLAEGDDLSGDYYFIDTQHGWVTTNTRLLATIDGGQSWQQRLEWELPDPSIGGPDLSLKSIDFVSIQEGFALQEGKLVHSLDGGTTWKAMPEPISGERIFSLGFVNSMDGWVITESSGWMRSRDGGKTWQSLKSPCPVTNYNFSKAFHFQNASLGWATCVLDDSNSRTINVKLFRSIDGGDHWEQVEVNAPVSPAGIEQGRPGWIPNIANGMDIPWFYDAQHGWTADSGSLFYSADGGNAWQVMQVEGMSSYLSNPEFLDAQTGYVNAGPGIPQRGMGLFKTTDGGRTWSQVLPALSPFLTSYLDERLGFGVDSNAGTGQVYRTDDSGRTWQQIGSLPVDVISIRQIQFADNSDGWILAQDCPEPSDQADCTQFGLYHTGDGGKHWQRQSNIGLDAIAAFSMVDSKHGYATSTDLDRFWITEDGLKSRQEAYDQPGNPMQNQFQFINLQIGYELSQGQLYVTRDGTRTWQVLKTGCSLNSFSLARDGSLWALTTSDCELCLGWDEKIISSVDGGQSWRAISVPGLRIMSIQFVDARHGYLTGGDHSWYQGGYTFNADHIYYTSDGGQTWTQFN